MSDPSAIKSGFERYRDLLLKKPSIGIGTYVSRTRVVDGLTCEVTEGEFRQTVDMARAIGGNAQGPTPGMLGRGALGSCLAIGYSMVAARLGVVFRSLEVEIQADSDDAGLFTDGGAIPGYSEVRVLVHVDSDASDADVNRVLDGADAKSPYLDVFTRANTVRRELRRVPASAT